MVHHKWKLRPRSPRAYALLKRRAKLDHICPKCKNEWDEKTRKCNGPCRDKYKLRYLKRATEGSHSSKEWMAILIRYSHQCAQCGSLNKITKDHIIPISKGGTNYAYNLQPLCHSCNAIKGNRSSTRLMPFQLSQRFR